MRLIKTFGLLTAFLFFTGAVLADTPNVNPGMWSYTTTTVIDSALGFPPQTETARECMTAEDIKKGTALIEVPEGCDVARSEVKRDTLDYAMNCNIEGLATTFSGQARFNGDRMDGEMRGDLTSPLGPMTIQSRFEAERVGDC